MIRLTLGNYLLSLGRSLAQMDGGELVIDVTEHRLLTGMERPDTTERAWDPTLFVSGQMYLEGYANPIKPVPVRTEEMEEMDEADVTVSDDVATDDAEAATAVADGGEVTEEEEHVKLLSSWRYKEYQDQHLITELVRPTEQWKMIIYILLGMGALILMVLLLTVFQVFA